MKHLHIKLLRNMLIAACAFCLPFLSVKAQKGKFEGRFFPPEMRYVSAAGYDSANKPTDSTVWVWTQIGFPVPKEAYEWVAGGKRTLTSSGGIVSDARENFAYKAMDTTEGVEVVMNIELAFNEHNELTKMTQSAAGMVTKMEGVYWHGPNNRLDSALQTTTITAFGMTMGSAKTKLKYTAYNTDGWVTRLESYTESTIPGISVSYVEETIEYFKNSSSGKMERQENITKGYKSKGGTLESITKTITRFDAKERFVKIETHKGSLTGSNFTLDSYYIFHYTNETGIASFDLLAQPVIVSTVNDWLSVNSPKNEKVVVYSPSGTIVYAGNKMPGETRISINNLSQGVYLVTGSSGWVKKIKK